MKELWTEKCSLYINKIHGEHYVLQKATSRADRNNKNL